MYIEVSTGQDEKIFAMVVEQNSASSHVRVKDTNCGTSTSE